VQGRCWHYCWRAGDPDHRDAESCGLMLSVKVAAVLIGEGVVCACLALLGKVAQKRLREESYGDGISEARDKASARMTPYVAALSVVSLLVASVIIIVHES
jgi:hypothetical protein